MASAFRLFSKSPSKHSSGDGSPSTSPTKGKGSGASSPSRAFTSDELHASPTSFEKEDARRTPRASTGIPDINVTSPSIASNGSNRRLSTSSSSKRSKLSQGSSDATARGGRAASEVVSAPATDGRDHAHSRHASAGPATAPMPRNRHDVMRRAQMASLGLDDSDEEEEEHSHVAEPGPILHHHHHHQHAEEGGYEDIADGRKLNSSARPLAPTRGRSNSDGELPENHHEIVAHGAHLPPMPAAGLPSSSREDGDVPSSPAMDIVPGEGSLTLDHILGSAGPEIVNVDGTVRRPGGPSDIGHGNSMSRNSSVMRHGGASSQGHGTEAGGVRGRAPAVPTAIPNGVNSSPVPRSGSAGMAPHSLTLSASASKPAEALLSPAQVAASSGKKRLSTESSSNYHGGAGSQTPMQSHIVAQSQKKKGSSGSSIANALAASGIAAANASGAKIASPIGNGHPSVISPMRTPSPGAVAALTPGAGAQASNGFQGGVYRNPSTGQMITVGEGQQSDTIAFPEYSRASEWEADDALIFQSRMLTSHPTHSLCHLLVGSWRRGEL